MMLLLTGFFCFTRTQKDGKMMLNLKTEKQYNYVVRALCGLESTVGDVRSEQLEDRRGFFPFFVKFLIFSLKFFEKIIDFMIFDKFYLRSFGDGTEFEDISEIVRVRPRFLNFPLF